MYKLSSCPLGAIEKLEDVSTMPGIMPRVNFNTSWEPSRECYDLMEEAAAAIHGVDFVILQDPSQGPSFALAIAEHVNKDDAAELWLKSFVGKLNMMDIEELATLRGGIRRYSVSDNMATSPGQVPTRDSKLGMD